MGQLQSQSCCSKSEQPDFDQVEVPKSSEGSPGVSECGESDNEFDLFSEPVSERGRADDVHHGRTFSCDLPVDLTQGTLDIFRGVQMRETMRWAGRIWRYRPSELNVQQRSKLIGLSKQVELFDIFFSHTWKTRGRWKVLSLVFQRGWPVMLAAWAAGVVLAFALCMLEVLPLWSSWQTPDTEAVPVGGWLMIFGVIFAIGGLASSPYFLPGWSSVCFLDVVCIDQTNEKRMREGINNIGSFLRASSELHVLWSGPYLSRLWCIFEIAAYRKLNPAGKIVIAPIYVELVVCQIYICMHCAAALLWYARQGPAQGAEPLLLGSAFVVCGCSFLPAVHALRKGCLSKHQLLRDLKTFSLEHVNCTSAFDRRAIRDAIVQWYGSLDAFSEYVRGPFHQEVLGIIKPWSLRLAYIFVIVTPLAAMGLEPALAMYKGRVAMESIISYFLSFEVGMVLLWLPACIVALDSVSDGMLEPTGTRKGYFQTLVAFAFIVVLFACGGICAVQAYSRSTWLVLLWVTFSAFFASLMFRRCWYSQ